MSTIVLAHGLFGFGKLLPFPAPVHYFNGVAEYLKSLNHNVIEPTVEPTGSIEQRSKELAKLIPPVGANGERAHIIAHSMGGLDARQALTNQDVAKRVATLVTIGTPHAGSPVADAIVKKSGPLVGHIPVEFLAFLEEHAGALQNLTTDFCTKFNQRTPDVQGV